MINLVLKEEELNVLKLALCNQIVEARRNKEKLDINKLNTSEVLEYITYYEKMIKKSEKLLDFIKYAERIEKNDKN